MKTLVIYYSRTETTKILAKIIAKKLNADIEEIVDKKKRGGPIGFVIAGRDAMQKRLTEISKIKKNPVDYDLVVIGTPVWFTTMSAATRTYVENNREKFKNVAFFSTQGNAKQQKVFVDLEELTGKKPLAKLRLATKEVKKGVSPKKLKEFINKLK